MQIIRYNNDKKAIKDDRLVQIKFVNLFKYFIDYLIDSIYHIELNRQSEKQQVIMSSQLHEQADIFGLDNI